jgi:hypothetical protein
VVVQSPVVVIEFVAAGHTHTSFWAAACAEVASAGTQVRASARISGVMVRAILSRDVKWFSFADLCRPTASLALFTLELDLIRVWPSWSPLPSQKLLLCTWHAADSFCPVRLWTVQGATPVPPPRWIS